MKKYLTLIFAILVLHLQTIAQCADQSNIYSFTYGGKSYEVVKEKKTWIDAAACAIERGGYLIEINDINEQDAIYDSIINGAGVSPTYTSITNGGGIAYVWIGATDQQNEGTWLWDGNNDSTGTHFWTGQGANGSGNGVAVGGCYNNWGGTSTGTPKEPDNYGVGQNHAAIGLAGWPSGTTMLGIAGEWNDIIGSSLLYFIIEYEPGAGTDDRMIHHDLLIYPNPTKSILNIEGGVIIDTHFSIYDPIGRNIINGTLQSDNNRVDIEALTPGFYFLRIEGAYSFSQKFIKE